MLLKLKIILLYLYNDLFNWIMVFIFQIIF